MDNNELNQIHGQAVQSHKDEPVDNKAWSEILQ